ncbi:MAG: hypothetical protein HC876_20920 [Chloroflexaceae bacterium]|nr:hypothetical protein [Chloroflexaceae bacterium]
MSVNHLPELFDAELYIAQPYGIHPVQSDEDNDSFDAIINEGTIKWCVTLDEVLLIIPKFVSTIEIAHSVLTQGKPVLAAGEAEIIGTAGQYIGLEINNHSGHYLPDAHSIVMGRIAFANLNDRNLNRRYVVLHPCLCTKLA